MLPDPAQGSFPPAPSCLIGCLWASEPGPGGESTHQPNRLFMGALPAVLDYQVATKFRRDAMGWKTNDGVAGRFLSELGYGPPTSPTEARPSTPCSHNQAHTFPSFCGAGTPGPPLHAFHRAVRCNTHSSTLVGVLAVRAQKGGCDRATGLDK